MKASLLKLTIIFTIASFCLSTKVNNNIQQNNQIVKFPFERKIWTYWNSDNSQIPLIVKICLDNLQQVAKKHNFTFVCLNQSNVRKYINNYDEQFIEVRKKSIQKQFAHAADLLRMIIIEQQGGIWVDSTTIFLNGLTELQNIMSKKYIHMITNRFSPQPDALLFYYSMGQNRIEQKIVNPKNTSQIILYNEMPNFQIWFIAAKKQSPVIKDIKKTYVQFTTTNFIQVQKKLRDEDIFMNRINDFGYYLYLNMAVSYTLQRKQSQLDKQLSLLGQRKSVFDEYKLWGLHSQYGPMIMIRQDLLPLEIIFLYSKEQLKTMGWNFTFFMKQFGYFRYLIGFYLDNLIAAFKDYNGSFNDWLKTNPDAGYCDNLTLIVEGSIFHKMLQKSKVFNSTKGLRIFTKQQLTQWNQYCSLHSSFFTKVKKFVLGSVLHTLILRLFMYDKVMKAKVHQILMQGQKLTLGDWIKIKYEDNSFLLFDCGYFFIVACLMFWVYKKLITKFTKILENQKEQQSQNNYDLGSDRVSIFKKNSILKTADELNNSQNLETKSKQSFLSFLIFVLLLSSLIMYNAVDVTGGRQQPYTIFFFIVFTFLLQSYIEAQTKLVGDKNKKSLIRIRNQYEFFYLFFNYITTYLTLVYVRRNRFWLNQSALVIGCIGPSLLKMARLINIKYEGQNQYQKNYRKSNGKSFILRTKTIRLIVIFTLLLITFIPNMKNISIDSGYILQYLPLIPLIYLGSLFLFVTYKSLSDKLWLELMRLMIIVIVVIQLCSIIEKIQFITNLNPRMLFIFRTVVILQAVYLQAGSSITIKNLHQCQFMKSFIKQTLIFIGPFIIEFIFGRFYWNIQYISYHYYDYSQHLVIYAFSSYIVALFTSLGKNNQYQSIENIELTQIEHTQIS